VLGVGIGRQHPIHYEHARVITVREAARLHSFPDWFDFGTSKLAAHKAILLRSHFVNGNSVPPLLALRIASQVWAHLKEYQCFSYVGRTGCANGDATRTTIILRSSYPLSNSFGSTDLLELESVDISVAVFTIFDSTTQHLGNRNYGTSILVDGENIKAGNQRCP
jgi:DNA (cytosine-5)-methyltransferase 1